MNLGQLTSGGTLEGLINDLQSTIVRINTVFQREHQADGQHKLPMWVNHEVGSTDFTAAGTQTWAVVVATQVETFQYSKHGTWMTLGVEIAGSTVGGTPAAYVRIRIPGGFTAKKKRRNMIYLTDAGVRVDGFMVVLPDSRFVDVYRADLANYTGGSTDVRGELSFETTA